MKKLINSLLISLFIKNKIINISSKSMNWSTIKRFHLNAPKKNLFFRTHDIQAKYEQHKNTLKERNILIDMYIKEKYLKNRLKWIITDNKFPYHIDSNIKHKILWLDPSINLNSEIVQKIIDRYVNSYKFKYYIYFQNHIDCRSVPGIVHYHIFVTNNN